MIVPPPEKGLFFIPLKSLKYFQLTRECGGGGGTWKLDTDDWKKIKQQFYFIAEMVH